jgi:hypothetical protein
MEEIKLWKIVSEAGEKPTAAPVEMIAAASTEQLLEDVLTRSPDLLMPDLRLIGRQNETAGGPLDLLGVDDDGRLVVFELKRGSLTRDAVAQAIDYGSYLDGLEPEELCHHINENTGKGGTEPIDDFGQWYQEQFQRSVAEIGRPRIVLVGLGVDERAKRMVAFLAKCELDISLITFHGFKQGCETMLARQVAVQPESPVKSTKRDNQAKLDKLLTALGIQENYKALVGAIKAGLGAQAYQWPNSTGYTFSLREVSQGGGPSNRSYLSMYTPEQRRGGIQLYLQPRAMEAVGSNNARHFAEVMGAKLALKPDGSGEIWMDGHKPAANCGEALRSLGQAIVTGWKVKMENQAKAEAAEAGVTA